MSTKNKATQCYSVFLLPRLMVGVVLSIMAVGCNPSASSASDTAGMPKDISPVEASTLLGQGAFLLDVRTQEEYDQVHIQSSTLIPLATLADRLDELPRDRHILIICRTGNRSAQARDQLLASGFTQVTSIRGGIQAWVGLGLPLE